MRSHRLLILFLCVTAALAGVIGSALADAAFDHGYRMTVNGRPASTESNTVAAADGRVTYSSLTTMTYPQAVTMNTVLVLDGSSRRPLSYHMEVQTAGGPQKLDLTFDGTVVSFRAELPGGTQTGSRQLHEGFVVWENNTWGMLGLVLEQMDWDRKFAGYLYMFVPSMMREFTLRYECLDLETVSVGAAQQPARRLRLTVDDSLGIDVWADPETRTPLRIRIPAQQVEVVLAVPDSPVEGEGAGNGTQEQPPVGETGTSLP